MQRPLLTQKILHAMLDARDAGVGQFQCSLDLQLSTSKIQLQPECWIWHQTQFPYPSDLRDRTIYFWADDRFSPVSRYGASLIKLVPTEWGPPTFEIDGVKMLPTAKISPYADAERKVAFIQPRGKVILDCCGGLGYFAAWCIRAGAKQVLSYEKNADVMWLRTLNPWSPAADAVLSLTRADILEAIGSVPDEFVDAVLHDPPRFGVAGELYSQHFYDELRRVLKSNGRLFHYTGSPNKVSSGRDLSGEVSHRLRESGFEVKREGDGILGIKRHRRKSAFEA